MEQELKTVRVGDSILAFLGKEKRSLNKSDNPELFDSVLDLIEANNISRIKDILFNIDSQIEHSFDGKIKIKNGKVYYDSIELPEIASKKIISLYASGEKNFSPIARFYEKLIMASKNFEKVNEILNSILSHDKSHIYFTDAGNLIIQAMIDHKMAKKTMYNDKGVHIYLFDKEKFGHDTNGEYYLISPMDILRTYSENMYVFEGAIAVSQYRDENEPEDMCKLTILVLRRARKLRRFNPPKGIFANDDFEDVFDIRFEFMKELNKTY